MVGSLIISLLQIYRWVWRWKNLENRSTFGEDMGQTIYSISSVLFFLLAGWSSVQYSDFATLRNSG